MPGQSGYAVGWGALALINAGLAQGKRRSGLAWFLLSLLLGPLATLLIVVLPVPGEAPATTDLRCVWVLVAGVVLIVVVGAVGLLAAHPGSGLTVSPTAQPLPNGS